MVEPKSSILRRAHGFLTRCLHARRYSASLPLSVSLLEQQKKKSPPVSPGQVEMTGQLRDISRTDLSLILPSMRFGNRFLMMEDYLLRVAIELPNGPVYVDVAPVCYDRLDEEEIESRYVIGARIVQMMEADRERLMAHILRKEKERPERLSFARDAKSI